MSEAGAHRQLVGQALKGTERGYLHDRPGPLRFTFLLSLLRNEKQSELLHLHREGLEQINAARSAKGLELLAGSSDVNENTSPHRP